MLASLGISRMRVRGEGFIEKLRRHLEEKAGKVLAPEDFDIASIGIELIRDQTYYNLGKPGKWDCLDIKVSATPKESGKDTKNRDLSEEFKALARNFLREQRISTSGGDLCLRVSVNARPRVS